MSKYFSKEKIKYAFYTMTHPMDAFYEIRHRGRGSVPLAVLLVVLFSFCYSMNRMLASFVVNETDPRTVDSLTDLSGVLLLYALFCVGNWSITCLMNGEGRLKDIATVVGYAMLPMILTYIPATLFSQVVAADEEGFYAIILTIGTAWAAILGLIGIMVVHNYTLGKTLLTLVLTVVAMCVILFLVMMISNLISQVIGFGQSVYTEIIFRG